MKSPPCHPIARTTPPRPPHPIPTFVTMAIRPFLPGTGWAEVLKVICPTALSGNLARRVVLPQPYRHQGVTRMNSDWWTDVRFAMHPGLKSDVAGCPLLADIVAKVENRTTLKISRKSIFGLLCCCVAFQRHYGGPWSILDETIWSLTSPRAKRISGSKNFRSPPQKDFCNNI